MEQTHRQTLFSQDTTSTWGLSQAPWVLCPAGGYTAPNHMCTSQEKEASDAPKIWEGKPVLLHKCWFATEAEMAYTPVLLRAIFGKRSQMRNLESFKAEMTLWDADIFKMFH